MHLLPKGGVLRFRSPVVVILSIQLLVLVGSITVCSDLFDPITRSADVHRIPGSSQISGSNQASNRFASRSLFPINDIVNDLDEEEPYGDAHFGPLPERDVEYTVRRGDTIASLWVQNGAPAVGATKAMNAVRDAGLSRFTIRSGEAISLRLTSAGDVSRLTKHLPDGSTLIISGSSRSGYDATLLKPSIEEEERSVAGSILTSFAASATDMGVSYDIVDDVVDLFSNRIEFSKAIQPGDSFTITFVEKRCKETGQVLDTGPIVSASLKRGEKLYAAIRHQSSNGSFVYYDENGQQGGDFFLRYPLKFTRISSTFSWARFHPVLQRARPHHGVDFAAPVGTPIRAVGDGVIEVQSYKGGPGNMIRLKHSDRWTTVYMHMQRFGPGIRKGQRVARGQVIGYVGSTGLSTGPHLHFELWENGRYVDPMAADLPSISNEGTGLPKGYLLATLKDLEQKHQKAQLAFNAGNTRHQG